MEATPPPQPAAVFRVEAPGEMPRDFHTAAAAAAWLCQHMTSAQLQYFRVVAVYRAMRSNAGRHGDGEVGANAVTPGSAKL